MSPARRSCRGKTLAAGRPFTLGTTNTPEFAGDFTTEPLAYRTPNWRAYNGALKQRGSLLVWLDPEMEWLAAPGGRRGRPAIFSDAAIRTCLTLKAPFGLPLHQTSGLVGSLLKLAKLNWPVSD